MTQEEKQKRLAELHSKISQLGEHLKAAKRESESAHKLSLKLKEEYLLVKPHLGEAEAEEFNYKLANTIFTN